MLNFKITLRKSIDPDHSGWGDLHAVPESVELKWGDWIWHIACFEISYTFAAMPVGHP